MEDLTNGEVDSLLSRLAEDIPLTGVEGGFVDVLRIIAGGDGNTAGSRLHVIDSDLGGIEGGNVVACRIAERTFVAGEGGLGMLRIRSEERRVGKECRSRCWPDT